VDEQRENTMPSATLLGGKGIKTVHSYYYGVISKKKLFKMEAYCPNVSVL